MGLAFKLNQEFFQTCIRRLFGEKNIIIFAGQNGFDGSAKALFKYIHANTSKKWIYVWDSPYKAQLQEIKENGIIPMHIKKKDSNEYEEIKWLDRYISLYYKSCAKFCIYENNAIPSTFLISKRLYLTHGLPTYKYVPTYDKWVISYATDILATSTSQKEWWHKSFPEEMRGKHTFITGLPRIDTIENDALKFSDFNISTKKVIIWMPTFRKSILKEEDGSLRNDADGDYLYGLPLVKTKDDLDEINQICQKNDVTLLIKPHPYAAKEGITDISYTNIVVWTNEWLKEHNVDSIYQFFKDSDAMLGDYSSAAFDYMFVDKPCGFVIDDFEEYQSKTGFAFDNIQQYMPGHKIKSMKDMEGFIESIGNNLDEFREERHKVHSWANEYHDFNQCERFAKIFNLL